MNKSVIALALLGALWAPAYAEIATSMSAGTTGIGAHLIMPYSDNLNFRFGLNGFNGSTTETTTSATYDVKARLRTFDALVDFHPNASAFRLSGGLIYNGNELEATASPAAGGTYTFNGTPYPVASAGNVIGTMEFNKIAPYLGIGYGNAAAKNKGWGFVADLGVMFQGSPETSLRSVNCTAGPTICGQLADDLAAESAKLQDDAKEYRFYPVARIGLSYKF
jgi:hypothetical protein